MQNKRASDLELELPTFPDRPAQQGSCGKHDVADDRSRFVVKPRKLKKIGVGLGQRMISANMQYNTDAALLLHEYLIPLFCLMLNSLSSLPR